MSSGRALRRTAGAAALLAAVLLAGGLTTAVASAQPATDQEAADVVIPQPFAADSGDSCPMGSVKGLLGWHTGARVVDVTGAVTDHPLPGDTNPACAEDGNETVAMLAASAPGVVAQQVIQRANNDQRTFTASFAFPVSVQRISVQVCRHPPVESPLPVHSNRPARCGVVQTYQPPTTG